jgi:hypothetical protein
MNKVADALISLGVFLIFGLLFLRDKFFGAPSSPTPNKISILLVTVGVLTTFPVSVPSLVLGIILSKMFPIGRNN